MHGRGLPATLIPRRTASPAPNGAARTSGLRAGETHMYLSDKGRATRSLRAGCLVLVGVLAPLTAGADVIALFDEVADLTVTPVGITYPAVTPEEIRTVYANDMAAVHIAMYDAVVSIRGGYEPFATTPTSPTRGASADAAAAAAACGVLRGSVPQPRAAVRAGLPVLYQRAARQRRREDARARDRQRSRAGHARIRAPMMAARRS